MHTTARQEEGGFILRSFFPPPPPQPEPACTLPAEPMFLVQTGMFCIEIIVDISFKRFIFHSEALAFASPGD